MDVQPILTYFQLLYTFIVSKYHKIRQFISILKVLWSAADNPSADGFTLNSPDDASALIAYDHGGQSNQIAIPFNRANSVDMVSLQATLKLENGSTIDITQQPGIPYGFSAKELGGTSITIWNQENGLTCTYSRDMRPMFAPAVME